MKSTNRNSLLRAYPTEQLAIAKGILFNDNQTLAQNCDGSTSAACHVNQSRTEQADTCEKRVNRSFDVPDPTKPTRPWVGGLAEWVEGDTAYLSIAFSWRLDEAYTRAAWHRAQGRVVRVGGPGIFTRKHHLDDVAEVGGDMPDAIARHNPKATFASRGCDVGCWWCIVPKMEGSHYTEFPDFVPREVLCDNNLSGLSAEYQRHIVNRYLATGVKLLDANSGFSPITFDDEVFARWKPINKGPWRFAYDCMARRPHVDRVMRMLRAVPSRKKRVYVMIGNEPFDSCMERIKEVIAWGGEPHVQPYIKLNALEKVPHVRFDWTDQKLREVARWANRYLYKYTDFEGYRAGVKTSRNNVPAPRAAATASRMTA